MVHHNLDDLPKLPKVIGLLEDVRVGDARAKANGEHQVLLHDAQVRQRLPVVGRRALLPLVLPLLLLRLDLLHSTQTQNNLITSELRTKTHAKKRTLQQRAV